MRRRGTDKAGAAPPGHAVGIVQVAVSPSRCERHPAYDEFCAGGLEERVVALARVIDRGLEVDPIDVVDGASGIWPGRILDGTARWEAAKRAGRSLTVRSIGGLRFYYDHLVWIWHRHASRLGLEDRAGMMDRIYQEASRLQGTERKGVKSRLMVARDLGVGTHEVASWTTMARVRGQPGGADLFRAISLGSLSIRTAGQLVRASVVQDRSLDRVLADYLSGPVLREQAGIPIRPLPSIRSVGRGRNGSVGAIVVQTAGTEVQGPEFWRRELDRIVAFALGELSDEERIDVQQSLDRLRVWVTEGLTGLRRDLDRIKTARRDLADRDRIVSQARYLRACSILGFMPPGRGRRIPLNKVRRIYQDRLRALHPDAIGREPSVEEVDRLGEVREAYQTICSYATRERAEEEG